MLKRILLIAAIVGIAAAHGAVFYKIDAGVRSTDASQAIDSRTRRAAYW